jgi:hypothetical protein
VALAAGDLTLLLPCCRPVRGSCLIL